MTRKHFESEEHIRSAFLFFLGQQWQVCRATNPEAGRRFVWESWPETEVREGWNLDKILTKTVILKVWFSVFMLLSPDWMRFCVWKECLICFLWFLEESDFTPGLLLQAQVFFFSFLKPALFCVLKHNHSLPPINLLNEERWQINWAGVQAGWKLLLAPLKFLMRDGDIQPVLLAIS